VCSSDLVVFEILLFVQEALHAHLADSPAVTQEHNITVADALHVHLADEPLVKEVVRRLFAILNRFTARNSVAILTRFQVGRSFALRNELIGASVRRSIAIRNAFLESAHRSFALVNALGGAEPVRRRFMLRNTLDPETVARILMPAFSVALGGEDITDGVMGASITMDEDAFCNEASLRLAGIKRLDDFQALRGNGEDVLVITIEGLGYRFLVEDVELSKAVQGEHLAVWGRSRTARLADPRYSDPVTKIWTEPVLASAVAAELAPDFSIAFGLDDWVIGADVLSAEREMPMSLLQRLAEVQGGVVRSGPGGELIFRRRYPVSPADLPQAALDATLQETDKLLVVTDRRHLSEGWDAVTVEGKTGANDSPALIVELDDDRNHGRTRFLPGEEAFVRVYPSPFDLDYAHQITLGQAARIGTFSREISGDDAEEIQVTDGRAGARYPLVSVLSISWDGRELTDPRWDPGGREIRFSVVEGCAGTGFLHLEYTTRYDLWKVRADTEGTAILCLEDEEDA